MGALSVFPAANRPKPKAKNVQSNANTQIAAFSLKGALCHENLKLSPASLFDMNIGL
jgi:hypothetical protein